MHNARCEMYNVQYTMYMDSSFEVYTFRKFSLGIDLMSS